MLCARAAKELRLPPREGGYLLVGGDGSPYSVKMRAYLRFRRIPFKWVASMTLQRAGAMNNFFDELFPELKAKVIPVLVRPDGTYANDSTLLILELEDKFPQRRAIPRDPALAFLCAYLEDFADEWVTKPMFEFRFHTDADALFGAEFQIRQNPLLCQQGSKQLATFFAQRQRSRREFVGSTDMELMELTLRTVCQVLEENLDQGYNFLFGHRPSAADFALTGHIKQFTLDPRPSRIVREYPGVLSWQLRMDNLDGLQLDGVDFVLTNAVRKLVDFANSTYLPFLLANARAKRANEKNLQVRILSGAKTHSQPPFGYQVKCLQQLQERYKKLDRASLRTVGALLKPAHIGVDLHFGRSKL